MAALSTQSITGAVVPVACNAGGDTFINAPGVFLHFENANGATRTVTIAGQRPCDQGFTHNKDYTVPANDDLFIPPVNGALADDAGVVHLSYSAVTGLTVAVLTAS